MEVDHDVKYEVVQAEKVQHPVRSKVKRAQIGFEGYSAHSTVDLVLEADLVYGMVIPDREEYTGPHSLPHVASVAWYHDQTHEMRKGHHLCSYPERVCVFRGEEERAL